MKIKPILPRPRNAKEQKIYDDYQRTFGDKERNTRVDEEQERRRAELRMSAGEYANHLFFNFDDE